MAIGTTAAIIMGVSAAASAYGAHKKAQAAKDAAKTQVAAAGSAKADLRPLYEQSVARLDPYAQLGGQAVGQLRALGGYGAPPPLPPGGSAAQPQVPMPPTATPRASTAIGDPRRLQVGSLADFGPPTGRSTSSYRPPASGRTGMTPQPVGGGGSFQTTGGGGMVMMQAPTGEQREVPAAMAAQLEQAGARRMN